MTTDPPSVSLSRVPDNIRAELARRRMTLEALATLLGMHRSTLYRRMGEPDEFTLGEVVRIADALTVPLSRLVNGAP